MSFGSQGRRWRSGRVVRMPGTFTSNPAGPSAQTFLDRHPFGRLFLVVKAQLFEQSSGRVEPGQLAFRSDDSRSGRGNLSVRKNEKMRSRDKCCCHLFFFYLRLDEFPCRFRCGWTAWFGHQQQWPEQRRGTGRTLWERRAEREL